MKLLYVIKKFFMLLFLFMTAHWTTAMAELPSPAVTNTPMASLSPMLKRVMPAVVNIDVQGQMPPGHYPIPGSRPGTPPTQGLSAPKFEDVGSGVIVDAQQGYIVTNAHVVRDAQTITVALNDGRRVLAKLIGSDAASDIAVIKIGASQLSALPFADSDKTNVGDFVVAIGSPFGLLNQTVTSGVVSAINRNDLGIEGYENFIQTDAPINPGNSGGALVNMDGQLIGINTAIIAPAGGSVGIGFAIPSNMAKGVLDQLIKYGKVERGVLGVIVQDVTPELAQALGAANAQGALVTQIYPGSPAAKIGLSVGDIVNQINGSPIKNAAQLRNSVGLARVGTTLQVQLIRNGKTLHFQTSTVPKESVLNPTPKTSLLSGMRLQDFDQLIDNQMVKGVQVMDVLNSSLAWLAGVRPGDVILSANTQPISSIAELTKQASSNSKRLLIQVQRTGGMLFLVIDNS